jgi:hypothetical protein
LAVDRLFAQHPLRRRLVALFAAYAIALASLLTSFGTARMAAEAAALPGSTALCHSDAGETAPAQQDDGGKTCTDCCCIGCLMLMGALPPPPGTVAAAVASAGHVLPLPAVGIVTPRTTGNAHRCRAPPHVA